MKALFTLAVLVSGWSLNGAEANGLIARFEVIATTTEGRIENREAVMFYTDGREVEIERIGSRPVPRMPIGSDASAQLLARLQKIDFPRIDYQRHFDALSKEFVAIDGHEVEVELHINGVVAKFRLWNPGFLSKRPDDKAASAVMAAVEAFVLSISKGAVFFQ